METIIGVWVFMKIVGELIGIFIVCVGIAYLCKSVSPEKKDVE